MILSSKTKQGSRSQVLERGMKRHSIAKANGISVRLELPVILNELVRQRIIDKGQSGISVLGLTTAQTLKHTADIFDEASPGLCEKVAIDLAEKTSDLPCFGN